MSTDSKLEALRDAQEQPFEHWWEREGQFGRAGGGEYEKTFAWNAWCAARVTEQEQAGEAQPAAWQERQEIRAGVFGEWYDRRIHWGLNRPQEMDSGGIRYQFRPLFTRPQQPLSEYQIVRIYEQPGLAGTQHASGTEKAIAIARAIEAAHGIGITKEHKT